MKLAFILLITYLTCALGKKKEEETMRRIKLILKPSDADKRVRDELRSRINKAEETCREEKCNTEWSSLVKGTEQDTFGELVREYDKCMDKCRMQTIGREVGMLQEIMKKADFWKNLMQIEEEMSLQDALAYWTEIKEEFKYLEEAERKYESAQEALKLTEDEESKVKQLKQEAKRQQIICRTGECASLHQKLLQAEKAKDKVELTMQYDQCMTRCMQVVADRVKEMQRLRAKKDYLKAMKEIRKEMSVLEALRYFDDVKRDLGMID
uniref:Transforming acidic coiled-coil-containing protein C-terminal domain-containing protein n=1 Tax=Trichuris muris TaxID=70415 RepID=A0A5S6QNW8_TRIMR